jgi:putative phosphoesterase
MVLGVLADTKGVLTGAQIAALRKAFKGVDAILHAGPVGDLRVIEQLNEIAPTKAVCGNSESPMIRTELYIRLAWQMGKVGVGLMHGYGKPHGLRSFLLRQFEDDPVQVIVYGSNYEPYARQVGEIYFFNPGSFSGSLPEGQSGRARSRVGLLFIRGKKVDGMPGMPL